MLLYEFLRFENAISLARNNIFSFWKTFMVAVILLYKDQKGKIDLRTYPGPLDIHASTVKTGASQT